MTILFYFLLLFIKFSSCVLYVDFKNLFISPGVLVLHGYFDQGYNYFYLYGENLPISYASFGDQKIFPLDENPNLAFKLYLEYFNSLFKKILIVHSYCSENGGPDGYTRWIYEIDTESFNYVHTFPHHHLFEPLVYLTLDISESGHKHPFVNSEVVQPQHEKTVTYTTYTSFNGIEFDGQQGPRYTFGSIFDSVTPSMIGTTKVETMFNQSSKVQVISRGDPYKTIIYRGVVSISYVKRSILEHRVWVMFEINTAILEWFQTAYIERKEKIDSDQRLSNKINLDISEDATNDFYNIVKMTGLIGQMGYTLYVVKIGKEAPIDNIIDSDSDDMFIHNFHPNKILSVEVVRNLVRTLVIVKTLINDNGQVTVHTDIYQKGTEENSYSLVNEQQKQQEIQDFESMFPIYLTIGLDDENSVVCSSKRLLDQNHHFTFCYINDVDQFGGELKTKFHIGTLMEINPYVVGNIPTEKFRKEYRLIIQDVKSPKMLVKYPTQTKPIETTLYKVYKLMT